LIVSLVTGLFPNELTPTVFDNYFDTETRISYWDTCNNSNFIYLTFFEFE